MNKRAFRHRSPRDKGFTLVELLVTLAILVILLAIGVPSMQGFLEKRVVIANADTFASSLKFARSEALKRGQSVAMCITSTADTVTPTCSAAGNDWNSGWLVFADANNNCVFENTEQLLKVQQAAVGRGALNGTGDRRCLSFTANGLALGRNATIKAMPSNSTDTGLQRCVVLSGQGRARIATVKANGDCND